MLSCFRIDTKIYQRETQVVLIDLDQTIAQQTITYAINILSGVTFTKNDTEATRRLIVIPVAEIWKVKEINQRKSYFHLKKTCLVV